MYGIAAWLAVHIRMRPRGSSPANTPPANTPPVTILKPLCGPELELYDCLRSFCDQAYPTFQIVFGVRDLHDPAVDVVRRLQREFSAVDLHLAVNPMQHGSSPKVSNLINMMPLARHDALVIADSDIRVSRDYLAKVIAPLFDSQVGIVTCAYRGRPRPGLWSLLGSLFINDWFMPSVRVSALSGSRAFAFGATIALRRSVLARIGGFHSIVNHLADDYRLGELTRRLGLRTVLSEVVVETCVHEPTLGDLIRHELRWLRTIRSVRPIGYSLSFVTFGVPVAALGSLMAAGDRVALVMLAVTAIARILLHWSVRPAGTAPSHLLVLPLRDSLGLILWCWGFAGRHVHWRQDRFRVQRDGSVRSAREAREVAHTVSAPPIV
jgi:ceramide glucosyltransferase